MHRNSFQKWADDYARAHGYQVELTGNWVTLHREGEAPQECMSAEGVQRVCTGVTLARNPNRSWFPA